MEFIKKDGLKLMGNGYLVNSKEEPISNDDFVKAQQRAHYLVKLAEATKTKDYVGKKPDNFLTTVNEVVDSINSQKSVDYTGKVEEPKMELKAKLAEEALAWIKFDKTSNASKRANEAMQQFNVIRSFEEFGLFFSSGIVQLEKIYSIEEILTAVKTVEPHLESIK